MRLADQRTFAIVFGALYNLPYKLGGHAMRTITYSEARQNLSETMVQTVNDRAPTLITRQNGESCVLMSLADFNSLEETAYLLRSPANAKRLINAIQSLTAGRGVAKDISE
jgi:antitoxin YefM